MKILVTGATGTVGSEVAKALLQRGAEVRALTRKQPELGKLSDAVEITLGDLSDPVSVTQAMVGVDKLFLLIGNVADEFTQALTAYGLAKKAGLKHVTYLSVYQEIGFSMCRILPRSMLSRKRSARAVSHTRSYGRDISCRTIVASNLC